MNSKTDFQAEREPKETSTPRHKWDIWHALLGAATVALGIISIWLWSESMEEKREARTTVASTEQRGQQMLEDQTTRSQEQLRATREEAARHQASAFAIAIQPIMMFKGQVPEITDRSIQTATESLARQGNYSLVSVTDTNEVVLASSDLTTIGRQFGSELSEGVSSVQGENQAIAPIGTDGTTIGWVVIRIRKTG